MTAGGIAGSAEMEKWPVVTNPDGSRIIGTVGAGTVVKPFNGQFVFASPDEPPYTLEVDWYRHPAMVTKVPVNLTGTPAETPPRPK